MATPSHNKPTGTQSGSSAASTGQNKVDAREIQREQGTQKDTPSRDHERERTEKKPAAAPNQPGADRTKQRTPASERPPQSHDTASEIDENDQPR